MLGTLGALDNISIVIRSVVVNARTPNRLRGRVNAVNAVFIECSNELGAFESGLVAWLAGPVFSVVSGGIGTLLVVIWIGLKFPELRGLGFMTGPRHAPPFAPQHSPAGAELPSATLPIAACAPAELTTAQPPAQASPNIAAT